MMNDFDEIQKIYEGTWYVTNGMDPPYTTQVKRTRGMQKPEQGPDPWRALRGKGSASSLYNKGTSGQYHIPGNPLANIGDEEHEHETPEKDIKNTEVLDYIDKVAAIAQEKENGFWIHEIAQLRKNISDL